MPQLSSPTAHAQPTSPLVLCDRLISLAQEADRAGHVGTASQLVRLAHSVFDEKAPLRLS